MRGYYPAVSNEAASARQRPPRRDWPCAASQSTLKTGANLIGIKPRFALFPLGPIAMNRGAKICLFLRLALPGEGSPHAAPGAACMRPSRTGCKQIFRTMQEKQILISINGRNHSVPCLSRVINKIMKRTMKSKGVFVERELFLYASNVVFRMRVLQNTLLVTSAAKPNIHGITCRMTALRNTDARASLGSQVIGMNMLKI